MKVPEYEFVIVRRTTIRKMANKIIKDIELGELPDRFTKIDSLVAKIISQQILKYELVADIFSKLIEFILFIRDQKRLSKVAKPSRYLWLKLTRFLFSAKTQNEVFLPIMADWDFEIFEVLKEDKNANLFIINISNVYRFSRGDVAKKSAWRFDRICGQDCQTIKI